MTSPRADEHAEAAFASGRDLGGLDLTAGATALAWVRLRQGRADEVGPLVDALATRRASGRVRAAAGRCSSGVPPRPTPSRASGRTGGYATCVAPASPPSRSSRTRLLSPPAATAGAGLRVHVLGEVAVRVDDRLLTTPWRSRKALEAMAHLAVAGAQGRRREVVIEALWPSREPAKGRTLLRTALSELRRVLEPGRQTGEPSRFITTAGERVVLADTVTDLDDATAALAGGDAATAFDLLAPGLADLDVAGDWWEELRAEVAARRIEAAERTAGLEDEGDGERRVRALEVLVEAEPWQRSHYDALASVHRRRGDDAAANAVERRWFAEG